MFDNLTQKVKKRVKSYPTDVGGNIGMMLAITMLPLIIVVGAGIDHSRVTSDVEKAQVAADSAALSVAAAYYSDFDVANAGAVGQSFSK